MGFVGQDTLNYILFTNPVVVNTISIAKTATNTIVDSIRPKKIEVKMVQSEPLYKLALQNGPFIRLAAISGAAAVILGAYGSHKSYSLEEKGEERRRVFDTASRYHFIHTLALLGLPMCRKPRIAGTFMISGIFLFCGTCYFYAFTGDKSFSKLTPLGGTCFILGWLGMFL
ncbi:transmembrane protein 256-like [Phymastichus coffea]|uniref:transmembrane protein 256-like n=1 Tax=Phymastichus coffea TaxID=108790 RepID=UPI00273BFF33|nr:transmembrane protein 256-like [Phymastichus coffea]